MQGGAGPAGGTGALPPVHGQDRGPHQRTRQPTQEIGASCSSRAFRTAYTNAYKVLYQEDSLGYIPEIYDSAQEGFPFIYVNGEKYDFSPQVLLLAERLVESYYRMVHEFRLASLRSDSSLEATRAALEEFDASWTAYEEVPPLPLRSTSASSSALRPTPSRPSASSCRPRRPSSPTSASSACAVASSSRGRSTTSCAATSAKRSAGSTPWPTSTARAGTTCQSRS